MPKPTSVYPWFAIRVKSNYEKPVALRLRAMGYDEYLPLFRRLRQWSAGQRIVLLPLFPGYIFSSFDADDRQPVLRIPGVVHIVSSGSTPIPLDVEELDAVRRILESPQFSEPWPFLEAGDQVQLIRGPLAGLTGVLVEAAPGSFRVVVSIVLLQRSVAVEVERQWVRLTKTDRRRFAVPLEAAAGGGGGL